MMTMFRLLKEKGLLSRQRKGLYFDMYLRYLTACRDYPNLLHEEPPTNMLMSHEVDKIKAYAKYEFYR